MIELDNMQEVVRLAKHGESPAIRTQARELIEAIQDFNKKQTKEGRAAKRKQKQIIRLHRRLYNRYIKREFLRKQKQLLIEMDKKIEATRKERETAEAYTRATEREYDFFNAAIKGIEEQSKLWNN